MNICRDWVSKRSVQKRPRGNFGIHLSFLNGSRSLIDFSLHVSFFVEQTKTRLIQPWLSMAELS